MAINDIKLKDTGGRTTVATELWQVAASATLIQPGEPVKISSTRFVVKLADTDGNTTASTRLFGIAKSLSTNTASVAGFVEVILVDPLMTWAIKSKLASTSDTLAKILLLEGASYGIDLTGVVFTIDTSDTPAVTNAFRVVAGNPDTSELYVRVQAAALAQ